MKSPLLVFIQIVFACCLVCNRPTVSTIVTDDDSTIADDRLPSSDVPIIRQINKVNDDGTYTYGYEAADGSFKIETRDVLGNVKGMFGFIDETGELKRVSYTANNSTGSRPRHSSTTGRTTNPPTVSGSYTTVRSSSSSSTTSSAATKDDNYHHHQSSSTKQPILLLKNNPTTPTYSSSGSQSTTSKSPVIQHIPKKILQELEDLTSTTTSTTTTSSTTTGASTATSSPDSDRYHDKDTFSDDDDDDDGVAEESSLHRTTTTTTTTANPVRKIVVSKRPIEEKEIPKGKGGNNLRRQLSRGFETRAGDTSHVYGGDGNSKYSSTNNVPSHLSALMSELRPIQAPRPAYIVPSPSSSSPHGYGSPVEEYPSDSELAESPQDVNDYPSTTTEIVPDQRRLKYASRTRPLKPTITPAFEETNQYLVGAVDEAPIIGGGGYRQVHLQPVASIPFNSPYNPTPPPHHQHGQHQLEPYALPIPSALRDELMAIIYQYLQARLNNIQNPYYNNGPPRFPPYYNPVAGLAGNSFLPYANYPAYGQQQQLNQLNQFNQLPYPNYYPPPFLNPAITTSPILSPYPVPNSVPYVANPNIQGSSRRPNPIRSTAQSKAQTTRSPAPSPPADDADLLQMLLASPTRIPIRQLKYDPSDLRKSSTSSPSYRLTQQPPIRNVQIISESTSYRPASGSSSSRSGTEATE